MTAAPPDGIDAAGVTDWFARHVADCRPPLRFSLVAGGRSNLTFIVEGADGGRWVLRRPPLHGVLPTAHDVAREHRIIGALAPTGVPVPPAVGFCDDPGVTGAPFYVMRYVDGAVVRDEATARSALDEPARAAAADALVDVLVAIHGVRPDDVGLGDLGRTDGYIERQLKRWHGQWEQTKTRELPAMDEVHRRLAAAVPVQGGATIVHGDYRLDNLILDPQGQVAAVLDWELCTLGDPLADVGMLMVYWGEAGDETIPLLSMPTVVDGFPGRAHVAARYQERSGRDLAQLDYYVAFGYWKIAAILEGVYSRFASGAYGDNDGSFREFAEVVARLADAALEALPTAPA